MVADWTEGHAPACTQDYPTFLFRLLDYVDAKIKPLVLRGQGDTGYCASAAKDAAGLSEGRKLQGALQGTTSEANPSTRSNIGLHRCFRQLVLLALVLAAAQLLSAAPAVAAVATASARRRRLLQQLPQWPQGPAPPPPPPPAYFATASSSLEFFQLLYGGRITEIRIADDITLSADDAIVAFNASGGAGGTSGGGGSSAAAALGLGVSAPVLSYNLTIAGASRGTHTRLDFTFLGALLRLAPGTTLTLRGLEVYRALNHIGQDLDFVAKSLGGTVRLENCVQRRAACMPFQLALAQILSLPAPIGIPQASSDVSLRNDSAFCWSTATLLPTCKQPSIDVRVLSVHVAPLDGILGDSGGYDVSYRNSHIVCDYPIDPDCLRTSTPAACLARELSRRFGNAVPPSLVGDVPGAAAPTGRAGRDAGGDDGGGGGGTSPAVIGLAAGLAGGGTVVILLITGFIFFVRQRRRRQRGAHAAAQGCTKASDSGGDGAAAASPDEAATEQLFGAGCGGADCDKESTINIAVGGEAADVMAWCKEVGNRGDQRGSYGRSGGGDSKDASSEVRGGGGGGSDSSRVGMVARAATAAEGAAGRSYSGSDPWDVEAIKRTLLGVRQTDALLNVQLLQLLGEGSFGKVYKGLWHGTLVALKVLMLACGLTQDQRRRQMAVMEAAISSAMSHPNIVQTYTYSFRTLREGGRVSSDAAGPSSSSTQQGSAAGAGGGLGGDGGGGEISPAEGPDASPDASRIYGHELLLVLEYCDRGSLRKALDAGLFHRLAGGGAAAAAAAAPTVEAAAAAPYGTCGTTGRRGRDVDMDKDGDRSSLVPAAEFSTLSVPPPLRHRTLSYTGVSTTTGAGTTVAARVRRSEEGCALELWRRSGGERRAYNYALILQVACDVASALLHLHSHGIVHGDVKASNVLLKTSAPDDRRYVVVPYDVPPRDAPGGAGGDRISRAAGSSGRGSPAAATASMTVTPPSASTSATTASGSGPYSPGLGVGLVAKVADFGLSTILGYEGDAERTHISALTAQGSLTHMAPELMLYGHISKRIDVYAFGILLFELFTGERAHRSVPRALLPHQVAICGLRPVLPPYTPPDYRALAESCWQAEPTRRPTCEIILGDLTRMRASHAAAIAAIAWATSRGASFSTAASPASVALSPLAATAALAGTRPDGWVVVPSLESSTCSSSLFAELVRTSTPADADAAAAAVPKAAAATAPGDPGV